MYRTAVVPGPDNTDLFPSVVAAWNASPMPSVPVIDVGKLLSLVITVNASCTVAFAPNSASPFDVFVLDPGDAASLIVADAGLPIRDSAGQLTPILRVKTSDAQVTPTIKVTALVGLLQTIV